MEIFCHSTVLLQLPLKIWRLGHDAIGCANGPSLCVALEMASLGKRLKMSLNVLCWAALYKNLVQSTNINLPNVGVHGGKVFLPYAVLLAGYLISLWPVHVLRSDIFLSSKISCKTPQQLPNSPVFCVLRKCWGNYCKCSHPFMLSEGIRATLLPHVLLILCTEKISFAPGGVGRLSKSFLF